MCEEWKKADVVNRGFGWNLAYETLLRESAICPGHPFCEVLANKPQPPIDEQVAALQRDLIISSLLFELPDGHAGMAATWIVRTKDQAFVWVFQGQSVKVDKQRIPESEYDLVFEEMACWRQAEPLKRDFGEKGYIGFLSLYKDGRSRQMLLTFNDLFEENPDQEKPGRFFIALKPLRSYW